MTIATTEITKVDHPDIYASDLMFIDIEFVFQYSTDLGACLPGLIMKMQKISKIHILYTLLAVYLRFIWSVNLFDSGLAENDLTSLILPPLKL